MSRELTALLEALRLAQLEKGSLKVADEIEGLLAAEEDPWCDTCNERHPKEV